MATDAETVDLLALTHDGVAVQDGFFQSNKPFVAFLSGIGCGKTTTLVYDFFSYAEDWPGSIQILTEPTYDMLRDVMVPTMERLYGPGRGGRYDWTKSAPINVTFAPKWGRTSEIWLRAADSVLEERRRGTHVARVGMDEVTLGDQEEAFEQLTARRRDERFGPRQTKVTGTPQGRNWVWRKFIRDPLLSFPGGADMFFALTQDSEDAGFMPKGYTAEQAAIYGGLDTPKARQELGGQFLEMAGQVYETFRREVHVKPYLGEEFRNVLGGIDFGSASPTALVVGGMLAAERLHFVDEWYKHQSGIDEWIENMSLLEQKWGRVDQYRGVNRKRLHWICDPAGKAEMQQLRNAGFWVSPARHRNRYAARVPLFTARLVVRPGGPGMYIDPKCMYLINETEGLMWAKERLGLGGNLQEKFARDCPDHSHDAAANVISEFDLGYKEIPQNTGAADNWVAS